jgi:hypothetical protein
MKTRLHTLYIAPVTCGTVHAFGERLGQTLISQTIQGPPLSEAEEGAIRHLRGSYAFRAEHDPRVSLHMSEDLHGWTIICEEEPLFALSSGPRHIYIKPLPESYHEALLYVRPQLREVFFWPVCEDHRDLPGNLTLHTF